MADHWREQVGRALLAMHSIGVDVIEIGRVERALERWRERFLHRVYSERERRYCRGRGPELAARFAAKEAVMKALGTGMRGVGWREIEVLADELGKPVVSLSGGALERARSLLIKEFCVSLSHSRGLAVAVVLAS